MNSLAARWSIASRRRYVDQVRLKFSFARRSGMRMVMETTSGMVERMTLKRSVSDLLVEVRVVASVGAFEPKLQLAIVPHASK